MIPPFSYEPAESLSYFPGKPGVWPALCCESGEFHTYRRHHAPFLQIPGFPVPKLLEAGVGTYLHLRTWRGARVCGKYGRRSALPLVIERVRFTRVCYYPVKQSAGSAARQGGADQPESIGGT